MDSDSRSAGTQCPELISLIGDQRTSLNPSACVCAFHVIVVPLCSHRQMMISHRLHQTTISHRLHQMMVSPRLHQMSRWKTLSLLDHVGLVLARLVQTVFSRRLRRKQLRARRNRWCECDLLCADRITVC